MNKFIFDAKAYTCCDGNLFKDGENRSCCGAQIYDINKHICCGDKLTERKENTVLQCCNDKVFNVLSATCCGDKVY